MAYLNNEIDRLKQIIGDKNQEMQIMGQQMDSLYKQKQQELEANKLNTF